ncbi:hypothetical protein ACH4SP_00095 [Streptomyces sp. NPDC021093]|uniref:hypothetical protein n=1 Tax=Streptomyces sp. NPDC021093 TaxID=3365112 RepID=UPI0037BDD0A8
MPGFLLHPGASVLCTHGGQAVPASPFPRVKVGGRPVVTAQAGYTVTGCPFLPPNGNGPCVSAQWTVTATRVKAGGTPVLLRDSRATCTPTGTPLTVVSCQTRAKGV